MADEFVIHFYDKTKTPITVSRNDVDKTTSFDIVGLFTRDHTTNINQALFDLLEHFAGPSAPSDPIEGQVWYDTDNATLNVAVNVGGSLTWQAVHEIYTSATPPPAGLTTVLWYDTSLPQLKVYDGSSYVSVAENYVLLTGDIINGPVTFDTLLNVDGTTTNNATCTVTDLLWIMAGLQSATNATVESANNILTLDDGTQTTFTADGSLIFNATTNITVKHGSDVFDLGNTGRVLQISNVDIKSYVPVSVDNNKIINVRNSNGVPTSLVPNSETTSLIADAVNFVEVAGDTITATLLFEKSTDFNPIDFSTLDFVDTGTSGTTRLANTGSTLVLSHVDTATNLLTIDLNSGHVDVHGATVIIDSPVRDSDLSTKQYSDDTLTQALNDTNTALNSQAAAWAVFTTSGILQNGYNVNSITLRDSGTKFDVNFTAPMADTNYVAIVTFGNNTPTDIRELRYSNFVFDQQTNYVRIARSVQGTKRVLYDIGDDDDDYFIYRYHGRHEATTAGETYITVVIYQ